MKEASIIGLDLAKRSFQAHGALADGRVAFRKKLTREKVLGFLAEQPRCVVAMEACGSAHHWGRAIRDAGHEVRLIPPAYVKPFVKRQKNDAADAEAIAEAASRPTMRFVAVKTEEQQARAMLFRTRDLLVRQRTQLINAHHAVDGVDEQALQQISSATGGHYYYAADEAQLSKIYSDLGSKIGWVTTKLDLTAPLEALGAIILVAGGLFSLRWFRLLP